MHAPQIVWLALAFLSIGISIAKHGEPQENYSFPLKMIGIALGAWILYWGGFFTGGNC